MPVRVGSLWRFCWLFAEFSLDRDDCRKFQLLGVVLVEQRFEVGAAACFVEAGGAYEDELLALAEALRVNGGSAADHADGGEFGDLVGDGHQVGNWAEWLCTEGGVEAGQDDAFAQMNKL